LGVQCVQAQRAEAQHEQEEEMRYAHPVSWNALIPCSVCGSPCCSPLCVHRYAHTQMVEQAHRLQTALAQEQVPTSLLPSRIC
jgi:hypothetical protein